MKILNCFAIITTFGLIACNGPDPATRRANFDAELAARQAACESSPTSSSCSTLSMAWFAYNIPINQGRDENGDRIGGSSELMKNWSDTERTKAGNGTWFVIWDGNDKTYKAVSLSYIRDMEIQARRNLYGTDAGMRYDEPNGHGGYTNNGTYSETEYETDVARETGRIFNDNNDVDVSNWEVVTYDPNSGIFTGTSTGYKYEDENETRDVSLMVAEKESLEKFERAASLSSHFQMNVETSLALVTLAEFSQASMRRSSGSTAADQEAFNSALSSLAGVTATDVMKAVVSAEAKKDMVEKIAKKIGTSSANLENRILPGLFGIEL